MEKDVISEKDGFLLRFARAEDATDYYEQNYCPLDKEAARLTGCKEEFTKEEVTSFFLKSLEEDDRYFFLIIAPNGKIIGSWATEVTRDFAFEELHLHRLELDVYSFNPRAEKVYLKAGFKREGILRDAVMDGGKYADDILMSILEDEWKLIKGDGVGGR